MESHVERHRNFFTNRAAAALCTKVYMFHAFISERGVRVRERQLPLEPEPHLRVLVGRAVVVGVAVRGRRGVVVVIVIVVWGGGAAATGVGGHGARGHARLELVERDWKRETMVNS